VQRLASLEEISAGCGPARLGHGWFGNVYRCQCRPV